MGRSEGLLHLTVCLHVQHGALRHLDGQPTDPDCLVQLAGERRVDLRNEFKGDIRLGEAQNLPEPPLDGGDRHQSAHGAHDGDSCLSTEGDDVATLEDVAPVQLQLVNDSGGVDGLGPVGAVAHAADTNEGVQAPRLAGAGFAKKGGATVVHRAAACFDARDDGK